MSVRPSPALAVLAPLVHHEIAVESEPLVVAVVEHDDALEIGTWPIPEPVADGPAESLIGWSAPAPLDLVGLSTLDPVGGRRTSVVDRTGSTLTVVGCGRRTVPDPPIVRDLLLRCFGLPTARPTVGVGAWLDLLWLDRLAGAVFASERSLEVADLLLLHPLHPLRGDSEPSAPGELRAAASALDRSFTWGDIRQRWNGPDSRGPTPPGGTPGSERSWFDDGSFARWHLSRLPAAERLLADLSLLLPKRLVRAVTDGLACP